MTSPTRFPFSAVVGLDDARLALLLASIDPGIGGVLLRGDRGSAKSTLARGLAGLLPGGAPFVELPLGATEDRVLGTLDVQATLADGSTRFRPGLLQAAHGGVLYVDEVNLLPDPLVNVLLDVAASGINRVERDGISHAHPARFILVGSMNPQEGELRPQLLDRFGLSVEVAAPSDPRHRAEVVRRRLTHDAGGRVAGAESDIVLRARLAASLPADLPDTVVDFACRLAVGVGAEGLRADLVLCRAAAAFAGWEGRAIATAADVERVAAVTLGHRRRRRPFDPPTLNEDELTRALEAARQSFAGANAAAAPPPEPVVAPPEPAETPPQPATPPPEPAAAPPQPAAAPPEPAVAPPQPAALVPEPGIAPSNPPAPWLEPAAAPPQPAAPPPEPTNAPLEPPARPPEPAIGPAFAPDPAGAPIPPVPSLASWASAVASGEPDAPPEPITAPEGEAEVPADEDETAGPTSLRGDGADADVVADGTAGDLTREVDAGDEALAADGSDNSDGPGAPQATDVAGSEAVIDAADPEAAGNDTADHRTQGHDAEDDEAQHAIGVDEVTPAPTEHAESEQGDADQAPGDGAGVRGEGDGETGDGDGVADERGDGDDVPEQAANGSGVPEQAGGDGVPDEAGARASDVTAGTPDPGDPGTSGSDGDGASPVSGARSDTDIPPAPDLRSRVPADPHATGDEALGPVTPEPPPGSPPPPPPPPPPPATPTAAWSGVPGDVLGDAPPAVRLAEPPPLLAGAAGGDAVAGIGVTGLGPGTATTLAPAAPPPPLAAWAPAPATTRRTPGDDAREPVRTRTAGRTVILAVDASGSAGTHRRVEAATGSVLGLLADAYLRRDRVALVTFRGATADVVLPPTASVELARNRLAELPTGGVTPLAEGIGAGLSLAKRALADGWPPLLVLISDGRATGSSDAIELAHRAASDVAATGVDVVVVDAEHGTKRRGLALELASAMDARYVRVDELSATCVEAAIRDALR